MKHDRMDFFQNKFHGAEIRDVPLQCKCTLFRDTLDCVFSMPGGEGFLIEAFGLTVTETLGTFREVAVALAFSSWQLFLAGSDHIESKFCGADFVDFIGGKFIVRPVMSKIAIGEHVQFMVRANFEDRDSRDKAYGTHFQISLLGQHLYAK